MHIGVIAPPWAPVPPVVYGGIEAVVALLSTGLQSAGHEVRLFTTGDSTCPVPMESSLPEAEGQRIGMAVPELRHVLDAYDAMGDVDIVHDHTVFGPFLAGRPEGVPVVSTVHGPLDGELVAVYERMARGVPLIAISDAQRRIAPHIPFAGVIHHGVDAADFPVGAGDGGYCVFLGRMTADKGPHRAIEAAHRAGARLLIAAKMREPLEIDYFESSVKPHLGDGAEYVGEVAHEEKVELLAGAMALLFPIRWPEPFGMVMIEALACGTPVLAFPEGAAPEVVDDGTTGFLCDDVGAMAEAIGRIDEIDRGACRAKVEHHFSAGRMVEDHISLFDDIVNGRCQPVAFSDA